MKIVRVRDYASLRNLKIPDVLPNLVVVTGKNGSGKTQFLRALESLAIETDLISPDGHGRYDMGGVRDVVYVERNFASPSDGAEPITSVFDSTGEFVNAIEALIVAEGRYASADPDGSLKYQLMFNGLATPYWVDQAERRLKKSLRLATRDELVGVSPLLRTPGNPLDLPIAKLFAAYESRRRFHRYTRFLEAEGDLPVGSALSEADFEAQYGEPPWESLDRVLAALGLPYAFVPPAKGSQEQPYSPKLQHTADKSVEISPSQLSSGEKALLNLAFSTFAVAEEGEASLDFPKLALLDEVDSVLHPTVVSQLFTVLEDVFVTARGASVVLVTHSPTTVALAPPDSLFVLEQHAQYAELRKASRDDALKSLLGGTPTLTVTNDNRRLVFTEGPTDARCLTELLRWAGPSLSTQFTLIFEPIGNRDLVLSTVVALRQHMNFNIFGLVDRDEGKDLDALPAGVTALPHRDAIENLAFDPLTLGLYLFLEGSLSQALPWTASTSPRELTDSMATEIADYVIETVSADHGAVSSDTVQMSYRNGLTLDLPKWYLDKDGHHLEDDVVLKTFPALKRLSMSKPLAVMSASYRSFGHYIPTDAIDLLNRLLSPSSST